LITLTLGKGGDLSHEDFDRLVRVVAKANSDAGLADKQLQRIETTLDSALKAVEDELATVYLIEVPEVWYQTVRVEGAHSREEALALAKAGEGVPLDNALEYSHTVEDGFDVSKVSEEER
jgi:hypothetical protein